MIRFNAIYLASIGRVGFLREGAKGLIAEGGGEGDWGRRGDGEGERGGRVEGMRTPFLSLGRGKRKRLMRRSRYGPCELGLSFKVVA